MPAHWGKQYLQPIRIGLQFNTEQQSKIHIIADGFGLLFMSWGIVQSICYNYSVRQSAAHPHTTGNYSNYSNNSEPKPTPTARNNKEITPIRGYTTRNFTPTYYRKQTSLQHYSKKYLGGQELVAKNITAGITHQHVGTIVHTQRN